MQPQTAAVTDQAPGGGEQAQPQAFGFAGAGGAVEGEHLQIRMRHGSAETTGDTYSHLWPDNDESTKAVIDALVDSKFGILRTEEGSS